MIDEPNNPIDEPSEMPQAVPDVGEADAAPPAVAANGAGPPAEAELAETPVEAAPDAEGDAAESSVGGESAEAPREAEGEAVQASDEESAVEAVVEEAASEEPAPEEGGEKAGEEETAEGEGEESPDKLEWYILKVQSNREDSIRDGLLRRVAIAGLDQYFGQVIVPVEQVTEFKAGKKRVTKRKLYPGYLVVQMAINDDTWFLVRETPGIGDFTGAAGHPTPMLTHEVNRILARQEEKTDEAPKLKIAFNTGDQVKINEGTFENFEGEVHTIDQTSGRVTVMINIFGRSTPVELEYWQIESI